MQRRAGILLFLGIATGIYALMTRAAAAVSDTDRTAVKQVLQAAADAKFDPAGNASSQNTARIDDAIAKVPDAALRRRITDFRPELQRDAAAHARSMELATMAHDVGGSSQTAPGGPDWLREIVGDDSMGLFVQLTALDFNNPKFDTHVKEQHTFADTGPWVQRIHDLDGLKSLGFQNTQMDDKAVAGLGSLKNLETLNVALCPVTDAVIPLFLKYSTLHKLFVNANKKITGRGFDQLAPLTHLEVINLHYTGINDEGLRQISTLPAVHQLELGHGEYTDKGIAVLGGMTRLKRIQVASRQATPAGIKSLEQLPNLEQLYVFDNLATDDSVPFVVNFPKLWFLSLQGPASDASIDSIAKLAHLKTLDVSGTKISTAGIARLKQRLPQTEIKAPKAG